MRTSLIVSLIISVLLNIALLVMAYDSDTKSKEWRTKYFDIEKKANEQFDHANQYALDKFRLQEQLKEIETRTADTNKVLEETRKKFQEMTAELSNKTKELEAAKKVVPPICPKPKTIIKYKRIPYDIAPSQQ